MIVTAKLRHLHIAPRKVRLVADIVRGKTAQEALTILNFTAKKAAQPILKLLNSALASAKNNFQLDGGNLYLSKITVDGGPKIKRWRARARGSAYEIQKKTSHINLTLEEITRFPSTRLRARKKVIEALPAEVKIEKIKGPEKPKPKPTMEIKKPVVSRIAKKIFRRQVF